MEIAPEAIAGLRELSALVQEPGLEETVLRVVEAYLRTVPSCLALRIEVGGRPVLTTSGRRPDLRTPRASLRLDLSGPSTRNPADVTVILLASEPDAFSAFVGGADPVAMTGFRIVRRTVDEDLPPEGGHGGGTDGVLDGHESQRLLSRALGVLLERGHQPFRARQVLREQARATARTELEQARALLDQTPSVTESTSGVIRASGDRGIDP